MDGSRVYLYIVLYYYCLVYWASFSFRRLLRIKRKTFSFMRFYKFILQKLCTVDRWYILTKDIIIKTRSNVNGTLALLFYYVWQYYCFVRLQDVRPCRVVVRILILDIFGQCNDGGPGAIYYSDHELKMYNKSEDNKSYVEKNSIKGNRGIPIMALQPANNRKLKTKY